MEAGKVGVILAKDMSRIGRNYLETGFYTEVVFRKHNVRFIAIANGVDAKTLSGILGHTNASFTLDTYTHVTPDMQKAASGIVGGFMEDLLGKGLRPWQRNGKAEPAL